MMRIIVVFFLVLVTAACGQKSATAVPADAGLVVRCGTLIDGVSDTVSSDQLVIIRDERIARILPADDPTMTAADILDLRDYTCLPGLIDMHVHFALQPEDADDYTIYLTRTLDESRILAENNAATTLRSGFTTVRHVGSYLPETIRELRDRINLGGIAGPRMQTAGAYLTIPHGGGDMYIPGVDDSDVPDYYRTGVARGPEAFKARAEEMVARDADFLKVIASGAVFGHGGIVADPEMTREEIAAVVEVAKVAGLKVTAHAHGAESIKDAILAGVNSIEHASLADDEAIALALQHGVAFSMDVYNGTYTEEVGYEQGYAKEFMEKNEETTEAQRVVFEKAVKAGVTILFGTDLGVLPFDLGTRQFAVMVERGMTPMQAIKSATSVAAVHLEMDSDVGALESGRYGDLIAVRGNPLQDIRALQDVSVVIKGGEIVSRNSEPATTDAGTE